MKAKILTKKEEKLWDEFIVNHPLTTIHQFSKWGHFQETIPSRGKYWIIAIFDKDNKIIGGTLLIRHKLPKNYSWLYSARGPLLDYKNPKISEHIKLLTEKIRQIAKQENTIFYRIDPPVIESTNESKHRLQHQSISSSPATLKSFKKVTWGFQPEHTLILDLSLTQEEILKQMKPKGRYNIRLAQKKGITVRKSDPKNKTQFQKDIDTFHKILTETTTRDGFSAHSKGYYKNMLQTLGQKHTALYLAEYQGKIIAGILNTYFAKTATYYFGASSNRHRNLMAPYLLQWTAIADSQKMGFTHYDFLGIAPPHTQNHKWKGITDFKKKFGGREITYLPAHELPLKKVKYLAYTIYKQLKK